MQMDMVKIGKFLCDLRKEHNLTQEELGEQIGVTNKTISRWENGNYLPPIEMLQILSKKYDVSINEILCGERLDVSAYKQKADENIVITLSNSVFTVKDKIAFFKKKWLKEHVFEIVIEILAIIALAVCAIIWEKLQGLIIALPLLALAWYAYTNNRLQGYIEGHVYDEQKSNVESDISNENKGVGK